MKLSFRSTTLLASTLLTAGIALPRIAYAADAGNPCGNFNVSELVNCKIETSGGCTADCTPLKLEASCTGGCVMPPDPACSNPCESTCTNTCNPTSLDCLAGCHAECDQQVTTSCQQQNPTADCVTQAKAQCNMHCQQSCSTPPQNCTQVCHTCCDGSCSAQINFTCDFQCFAHLQGGCNVQCQQPEGALFCNGQYVGASDVQACITYLVTQGITVDLSARGSAQCDAGGCYAAASAKVGAGCVISGVTGHAGDGGLGLFGVVVGSVAAHSIRRRLRK